MFSAESLLKFIEGEDLAQLYKGRHVCIPFLALDTYISFIKQQKNIGFDIGDQADKVLIEFSKKQYLSTYQIYSNFKRQIDYKNTLKRVKRLESLGFIESVKAKDIKVEESQHRAKYYRISEAGMFQLFLLRDWWIPSSLQSQLPIILESHGEYLIFETLLYPNFKKETLPKLQALKSTRYIQYLGQTQRGVIYSDTTYEVIKELYHYLRNCCTEIFEYVKTSLNYYTESNHTLQERALLDYRKRYVSDYIALERDQLVIKILLLFHLTYEEAEQMDVLTILAKDDKFMKVADDLHNDFNKSFVFAMQLGKRSG
jgi:hypothetical protein